MSDTVAQGIFETSCATAFVHASAAYPRDQTAVETVRIPKDSAGMATSVGIAAYANAGIASILDNVDSIGTLLNIPTDTGSVATVAATVAARVSRRLADFGTKDRFSDTFGTKAHIPRVAENERRNDASVPMEGSVRTMHAATKNSTATGSAFNAGASTMAALDMRDARMTGIPDQASTAYPQIAESSTNARGRYASLLANIATMPATTAILPQLATTRCERPLVRYSE